MADFKGQSICIKFCFKLGKTAAETHRMLDDAFGVDAMSKSKMFSWHKCFKEGRMCVDDDERSGRPATSTILETIAEVRKAVLGNRRLTIKDVCDIVVQSYGTVQRILSGVLNMRRISKKFVP